MNYAAIYGVGRELSIYLHQKKPSSTNCRQKEMDKECRAKRQVKGFHAFKILKCQN
jgi:hypothetical protein